MAACRRVSSLRCPGCGAALLRGSRGTSSLPPATPFPPSRVVVLKKTTRLQYERNRFKHHSEVELRDRLSQFGSDYENLLQRHDRQTRSVETITDFLESQGVAVRIRDRENYSESDVAWAESIFSAGGDGNFLWASSKVLSCDKLVVGLNTDPSSSEGFLCLNSTRYGSLLGTLQAVFRGVVPCYRRSRIRVLLDGRLLPVRSLNEVFIGEQNPSHAAYYELSKDGGPSEKQKSSGLLAYTGTGSTSWAYNCNKMAAEEVERVLDLARDSGGCLDKRSVTKELVDKVTEAYNSSNVFPGDSRALGFVVREPIIRGIFAACHTQGRVSRLKVRSLSWKTELVIDGQFHFDLRRGGVAECWLHPQDVLTTLHD